MEEQLIKLFKEYLTGWSWDEWQAAGSSDREEIVVNTLAELGPQIDIEDAYDLFYDWAAGLTEADFVGKITEAVRVISDPDALFHYTTPLPFCRILKDNTLKKDVNCGAVCFTTDANYRIYNSTCGFQLSRAKLAKDGFDLVEWDDAEEDNPDFEDWYKLYPRAEDAHTESEERVYKDVKHLTKYLTDVHIHWSPEGMTQTEAPDDNRYAFIEVAQSEKGEFIGDEDHRTGAALTWKISMAYFRKLLNKLQASGVKVHEYGTPMEGLYWLDSNGKLQFGAMPGTEEPIEEPVLKANPESDLVLASNKAETTTKGNLLTEDNSDEELYWEFFGNDDDLGCSYCCPKCRFQTSEESFWSSDFQTFKPFTECPKCGTKLKA